LSGLLADALIWNVKSRMARCMDNILRFWVDCEYRATRADNADTKSDQIAEILLRFEGAGDALRYLAADGRIAWKASPGMLERLGDAEREVEDDLDEEL
jgi:hypothetical protein